MKTSYDILGVSPNASQEEIKKAYRKLAKQHHPDANGGSAESQQRFMEISEAYKAVGDEASRHSYDQKFRQNAQGESRGAGEERASRSSASQGTRSFNMEDFSQNFEQFFGFNPKTGRPAESGKKEQAGKNQAGKSSDWFESYFGVRKNNPQILTRTTKKPYSQEGSL
ncbi:J domain-containing protein [Paenibacillus hexagrammi]|uniref:DnaJ domain-containing protein n=1 Tax=Paenibacillus hexagrammi TaxID=2908839 RepID=A0ABY3SGB0_9BACL|nr:DnaJ domain-containing protein [Paenibacillus sp. YPD9-1]UJF32221.1 DnaJ domain-containing protein [Paenibacillus sp. YPD9-1]